MTRHFEEVWIDAEKVAEEYYKKDKHLLPSQVKYLANFVVSENISNSEREEHMGRLLLALSHYSNEYNINVWPILKEATDNAKLEMLDPEVESVLQDGEPTK